MKNVYQIKFLLHAVVKYYIVGHEGSCHGGDISDCNECSWLSMVN